MNKGVAFSNPSDGARRTVQDRNVAMRQMGDREK